MAKISRVYFAASLATVMRDGPGRSTRSPRNRKFFESALDRFEKLSIICWLGKTESPQGESERNFRKVLTKSKAAI